MHAEFWLTKWSEDRIGFHEKAVNPLLMAHWHQLGLKEKCPVLVPLCGKSQDLLWLNQQGHPVVGVELSRQAIEAFDTENGLQGHWTETDGFAVYKAGTITLWHGDFLQLNSRHIAPVQALYDRAALIALPPDMRRQYSQQVNTLTTEGCRQLLITLEYDPHLRSGPPFSVCPPEVADLYSTWQIETLGESPVMGKQPPSQDRVHRLRRHKN